MQFRNTLEKYWGFVRWLVRDSLWRRRGLATVVVVIGVLGVSCQVMVFGLVIYYAEHFSSGESITVVGATFEPRTSIPLLIAGSGTIVVLLLLSALCIYYSRRTIICMAREYEEICVKRVFRTLGSGGDLFDGMAESKESEAYLLRLVRADSRIAGRVLRRLLSLVVPGTTLLVAVIVLLYLEVWLTAILAVLGGALLFYQYHVSRTAAEHSIKFEKWAQLAGAEYKGLVKYYRHLPRADTSDEYADSLFAKGPVRKQLNAYEGRLRAVENSRLVSGVFMAVGIGLIIVVMGGSIIQQGSGWGRLLIYVIALRFAMMNVQIVFSAITGINRFYPQLRRYLAFVRSSSASSLEQYPPRRVHTLSIGEVAEEMCSEGSWEEFELRPGARLALVTPLELNRYTLAGLCGILAGGDEEATYGILNGARYASVAHGCPRTSLRRVLGLSAEATWSELRDWFPNADLWGCAREQLPSNLDKKVDSAQWEAVAPELKFVLSLISARIEGCFWLFLQVDGLRQLGPEAAPFYLNLFADAVTVVVHGPDLDRVGTYGEHGVAVTDGEMLLALGPLEWFESAHGWISETVMSARSGGKKGLGKEAVDDDDFADDEME